MSYAQIIINQLNYSIQDNILFKDLSLAFSTNKTGLIGKNGIGKSTLLKLIGGELLPNFGSISITGKIAYCPQSYAIYFEQTIAEVLEIKAKLIALEHITFGSTDIKDFEVLNEDWNIKERITKQLLNFGLTIDLNRPLNSLSGGEITRLMLARQFILESDFIILDEPTNNLDIKAKHALCSAIKNWHKGLLVVSHDRTLLNLMDQIIELSTLGAKIYGGNYDFYLEQKALEREASLNQLADAKKHLQKTTINVKKARDHHAKQQRVGKKLRETSSQAKIILNAMEDRSTRTQGKIAIKEERLITDAQKQLTKAKENVEIITEININLPNTYVPTGKIVLQIDNLSFYYDPQKPLIKNFSLTIQGPERVAIVGENGSGKTTLIKLIMGELIPKGGDINLNITRISYLDQQASQLNSELSILDNFKNFNPDINDTEAHLYLAQFLFRNIAALKLVKNLSGGEKLRALLACVLMSQNPPQLLILDEPTNHLDLESIASIESALKNYQGAIMVISHDEQFIKNIGIIRVVEM